MLACPTAGVVSAAAVITAISLPIVGIQSRAPVDFDTPAVIYTQPSLISYCSAEEMEEGIFLQQAFQSDFQ